MKNRNLKLPALTLLSGLVLLGCNHNLDHNPLSDIHTNSSSQSASGPGSVYYQSDILPLVKNHCLPCHGPAQAQPDWTNYATAKANINMILSMTGSDQMPLTGAKLTPAEKALLKAWADGGMPEAPEASPIPAPTPTPSPNPTPAPGPTPAPVPAPAPIPPPSDSTLQTCFGCHGNLGQSTTSMFPKLAAQTSEYISNQLTAFHDQTRKDDDAQTFMWPVAAVLSSSDIASLANYFSSQPADTHHEDGNAAKIAKGKDIFNNGIPAKNVFACSMCHGANGQGNQSFPRLAGQFSEYISKQLNYFKSGKRANDTMSPFAQQMSDEDIEDVSEFVNTL